MDNAKYRKYPRTIKKSNMDNSSDDNEMTFSSTAALGILFGTFLLGWTACHFICRK